MRRRFLFILLGLILVLLIGVGIWWKGVLKPLQPDLISKKPLVQEPIVTSEDLIAKALKAGQIDYETSLLYRAYALFGDQRLPQQYHTDVLYLDAGTHLFAEIIANQDKISSRTLEALTPFMARPNDPRSIFNISKTGSSAPSLVPFAYAGGAWISEPAAGGLVRIWTRDDYRLEGYSLLSGYALLVDEIWPKLIGLIRGPIPDKPGVPTPEINPDLAIDIYLVPLQGLNPRLQRCLDDPLKQGCKLLGNLGFTVPFPPVTIGTNNIKTSAYIVILASLKGDPLAGTIAHELFHTSQYSYDLRENKWLEESTATWGEFRILQQLGRSLKSVHSFLPSLFVTLDLLPLWLSHEYASYLYFLFAQMEKDDRIVRAIWEKAEIEDGVLAIDKVFPFEDHFREFALRNWNFEPVKKRYEEADRDFPLLGPSLKKPSPITLLPDKKETLDTDLFPLTAWYYSIKVPKDIGIHKVKVQLGDVTSKPYAGVDALLTIEGKPAEVRHWSDKSEETFCLDEPNEKLRELVLIISNASLESNLKGKIEIEPSSKSCAEGQAKLTVNYESEVSRSYPSGSVVGYGRETSTMRQTLNAMVLLETPKIDDSFTPIEGPTGNYGIHYDNESGLGYDGFPDEVKLISFTGIAKYSYESQFTGECGTMSTTAEGNGVIGLVQGAQFVIFFSGNKFGPLNMHSGEFTVAGQNTVTVLSNLCKDVRGGTFPYETKETVIVQVPPNDAVPKNWTVQVRRTPNGYTGTATYSIDKTSSKFGQSSSYRRNETIGFTFEIGRSQSQ